MLNFNKIKRTTLLVGAVLIFSTSAAQACNPLNPICLFKMVLKATPGLPVMDFVSIPPIIPHVPAALLKEAQAKVKEIADNALEKIRSGELPSMADIEVSPPEFEGSSLPEGEEIASLEAFPVSDPEDPLNIAQSVELIFLKPGYQSAGGGAGGGGAGGGGAGGGGAGGNDSATKTTIHDRNLTKFYMSRFHMENVIEVAGFVSAMSGQMDELITFSEDIQKQVEEADDLNKAQRANYAAHLMEFQLMIMKNQLEAANSQLEVSEILVNKLFLFNSPVLGN